MTMKHNKLPLSANKIKVEGETDNNRAAHFHRLHQVLSIALVWLFFYSTFADHVSQGLIVAFRYRGLNKSGNEKQV